MLSTQNLKPERKQRIIEKCLEYDAKVLNVPPVSTWINGELSFNQIKTVKIEDLLEREVSLTGGNVDIANEDTLATIFNSEQYGSQSGQFSVVYYYFQSL